MSVEPLSPRSVHIATSVIAALSAAVLLLTADYQIYDNNFYALSEATALLAGEHPYRDFFEWGIPLQAWLSAAAQYLSGQRLIGEFLLQWSFIVAGVVIAFRLALRLSHSVAASVVAFIPAVLLLAASPTYQYPKVFVYPCAILLACRYVDRPSARRSAAVGAIVAIAFLFRHDHGLYVGSTVLLAFTLAVIDHPHLRRPAVAAGQIAVCAAVCAALLLPWAHVVARSEGLLDYVEARAYIRSTWSVRRPVFAALLELNPIRALTPDRAVAADAEPYERLLATWLPGRENAEAWLYQMTLLVSIANVISSAFTFAARWARPRPLPQDANAALLTGVVLIIVARQLFREPSYFVMVTPLIAACGARFLARPARAGGGPAVAAPALSRTQSIWYASRGWLAIALLLITLATVLGYSRESNLPQPIYQAQHLPQTWARLIADPPIDGYVSAADAESVTPEEWKTLDTGRKSDVMLRYVYECSAPGDHVFVNGPTPYQVAYYVRRPVAGGHLYWHDGWRSDPIREAQSLALLQQQSVPFAYSTADPVLDDLRQYPRIRRYVEENYREIPGTGGRVLVNTRRPPVRRYGRLQLSCFR